MRKQIEYLVFAVILAILAARAQTAPPESGPMIIDQIKNTVVFLESSWTERDVKVEGGRIEAVQASKSQVGTGFLIWVPVTACGPDQGQIYLVTAKHMIREKLPNGRPGPWVSKVMVRFNNKNPTPDGKQWDTVYVDVIDKRADLQWFIDEGDRSADVALLPVVLNQSTVDFRMVPNNAFATRQLLTERKVNENDEVLFTGLFTGYFGLQRNYPVVRHGRLALIPKEPVSVDPAHPEEKTHIYLVDVMSFGGNSGSPVFLRLGGIRETTSSELLSGYSYYLLGVMQGFFRDVGEGHSEGQNSGIAVVVPVDKILDIISGPRNMAYVAEQTALCTARQRDLSGAERGFREAIALLEKTSPDSSHLVRVLNEYADFLQASKPIDAKANRLKARGIESRLVAKPAQP